ncbi:MAG: hypothetical protein KH050_06820 [Clostridiaceae bacterium]|nr:hypothetical protein [Clostridiaceae bacterium]
MKKNDYGFYGKGIDGYVHYKQAFDESQKHRPRSNAQRKSISNKEHSSGRTDNLFNCIVAILGFAGMIWIAYHLSCV